jgi:hypothetical protein
MCYDHSLYLKKILDQHNLLYIRYVYICNRSRVMSMRDNEPYYGLQPLSNPKDILKFIYYFMILFLTEYIFKHFLLLVPFSH